MQIWFENYKKVFHHNNQKGSFTMEMNEFADMDISEFASIRMPMNMYKPQGERDCNTWSAPSDVELPTTVDWRTKGVVTPIKNQGQCGSCWAFSTTGSMEGQYALKHGTLKSFAEQQLVDCCTGNYGCNGGWMDTAFRYINTTQAGIELEESYPYVAHDETCHYKASEGVGKDYGCVDVGTSGSEADLQVASATIGPISVAIDASHTSFQMYKSGVYNEPDCSTSALDHAVLVVGYGTYQGSAYWLVKNSWGTGWGMSGYIMMSRNKNNQCGIATQACYPKVE